jgi:hypothetical protein
MPDAHRPMTLYDYTTSAAADRIVVEGFKDSPGDAFLPAGVWLSDSAHLGRRAMRRKQEDDVMLAVEVPDEVAATSLAAEFPGGWREFCVPAQVLNLYPVHREADP